jgi:hypothetical protein
VWDAVEAGSPAAPPVSQAPAIAARRPPGDRRGPRLRLSVPRVQRILSRGYLVVRARCDERCRLDVTGTARTARSGGARGLPALRGARGAPGRVTRLRLRIPARVHAPIRRTLLRGGTVAIRLKLVARDRAGNATVARRTVRLRRR